MERPPLKSFWKDPLEVSEEDFNLNPSRGISQPISSAQQGLQQFQGTPVLQQEESKKGFAQRAMDFGTKVSKAVGLGSTVDYLGKVGATLAHPRLASEGYIEQPTLKESVGSGLQLGATIAGAGVGGGTPGILKAAAAGGLTGAASSGGQALASGQSLKTVGEQALKGGAIGAAIGGGVATLGRFLERTGDKIQFSVIKPVQADLDDGFSVDTIKKYNLGGSLNQVFRKTESTMDDLTKELNSKLRGSSNKVDLNGVLARTMGRLENERYSTFGSNTSSKTATDWLGKEIQHVGKDVSLEEANIVKRAVGHYGAWVHGVNDPDSTARQKVANIFYNELKKEIENLSPEGVGAVNKKLSELIPVLNAVIRRIPIAERNNTLSLTDIISLVGAAVEPRVLGLTLLNFASKSGVVGNALSRSGAATVKGATPLAALIGAVNPTEPDYESTTK